MSVWSGNLNSYSEFKQSCVIFYSLYDIGLTHKDVSGHYLGCEVFNLTVNEAKETLLISHRV